MTVRPKIEADTTTKPETDHPKSLQVPTKSGTEKSGTVGRRGSNASNGRTRANSKSITSPEEQSRRDKDENLRTTEAAIKPKLENGTVTQADSETLRSRETRNHGNTEKGGFSATAQSFVSRRRHESLSDVSNSSATDHRKEQSQHDKDLSKVNEELEDNENEVYVKNITQYGRGHANENGEFQLSIYRDCRCCSEVE
jgi:hypothetical protein